MSLRVRRQNAFTLIELMIAVTILIIGVVGVLLVIPVAQRTANKSGLATRAAILASEKIEELKAKGVSALIATPTWSGTSDEFTWEATVTAVGAGDFTTAETVPSQPVVRMTMRVTYPVQGKPRTETFTTFYSEL